MTLPKYDAVVTNKITRELTYANQVYIFTILLISHALQQSYEDSTNCKSKNWLLISFTPSKEDANIYKIQWSIGL